MDACIVYLDILVVDKTFEEYNDNLAKVFLNQQLRSAGLLTTVAAESKTISGDSGSSIIITLYLISKRLDVTKRHSL